MRFPSVATLALPSVLILSAVAASSAADPRVAPVEPAGRAREIHRIQAHFDSVLTELGSADPSRLTAPQRARRTSLVETLRAYRDGAEFPHNYDFPGEAVPYFVDRGTGVVCAVGHLLATSGRRDIVERVAAMDNNIWVAQLARDTAFVSWIDFHGITLAEAARIQVPYMGDMEPAPRVARNDAFPTGTGLALGTALIASYWNARPNAAGTSRVANVLGAVAGAASMATGATTIGGDGISPAVGAASIVAGAASAWLSTRNVMRYRRLAEEKRDAARASVAPMMPIDGSSGAGVVVTLRF